MPREVRAGVFGFFWTLFPSFVVEPEICPIMEPIDPKIGLLCLHKGDCVSEQLLTRQRWATSESSEKRILLK